MNPQSQHSESTVHLQKTNLTSTLPTYRPLCPSYGRMNTTYTTFVCPPLSTRHGLNSTRLHARKRSISPPKRRRANSAPPSRRDTVRADLGHERLDRGVHEDMLFRIMDLQEALDDAIDAEEYTSAADIRDQLSSAKDEDCVLILTAHLRYYDAFNKHSLERLSNLWDKSPSVICQHPLSSCHIGYDSVLSSFAVLFATLPADLVIDVSDVRIASFGAAAYVTCVEIPRSSMLPVGKDGKERQHGLQSTSVFEKRIDKNGKHEYFMVHHVSTPIFAALSML